MYKYEFIGINDCLFYDKGEQKRLKKGDIVEVEHELKGLPLFRKIPEKVGKIKKEDGGKK